MAVKLNSLRLLVAEIDKNKNPQKGEFLKRFFKTGKGQYGEGDIFLGLTVPMQREIAKKFTGLAFTDLQRLIDSPYHEYRLISLLILTSQFNKAAASEKEKIVNFYLTNSKKINNWDLVDLSSHEILGNYFLKKDKSVLFKLAKSDNLWQKRISIVATYAFLRNGEFAPCLKIYAMHLKDEHDLIHKAVGWMLRELGKRNLQEEVNFLNRYAKVMPRTMLRYALEKFPEEKRRYYLKLK